jgi:transaldolase
MNTLLELSGAGQSVWLDDIHRKLITSGELVRLVEESSLRGVTSNPSIFEKALATVRDYDDAIRAFVSTDPEISIEALYQKLAIFDLRAAADVLRPVYEDSQGTDGFVSIEVSPKLADDTEATIAEVRRLWARMDRPNTMVKIPATPAGIPAITAMLAEGININITLMFSMAHYEAVANAYIEGIERATDPRRTASVASFFVSRVDTKIDRALANLGTPEALALRGKIAVANSKLVYARFREIFGGPRFAEQRRRGANLQRVLWASTSSKNPAYPDVVYVEQLVGPDTVDTMPLGTLRAFEDHGHVRPRAIEEGLDEARAELDELERLGIDLERAGEELQQEGVAAFASAHDKLFAGLGQKVAALTGRSAA